MQPSKISVLEGAVRFYVSGKIRFAEKALISLLLLGYILMPADLICDAVPVIGWLDDIGVSCLILWYFSHRVTAVTETDTMPPQKGQTNS